MCNNTNKKVLFKNFAPYTDCISETNNTQVDNAKDIDVIMPIYILVEYSDNYSKISGSLWQYYRDEPSLTAANTIEDFTGADHYSKSFKFKQKITGQTSANGTRDVGTIKISK